MDQFEVTGGAPLRGRVAAAGSKNAVLPIMAACLLTDEPLVVRNVPALRDVATLALILEQLGVSARRDGDSLVLQADAAGPSRASYDLVSTMRASVCVLGPLVARRGRAEVSMPGGCVFGVRPVDQHIKGLNALGAAIDVEQGYLVASDRPRLHGADVYLGTHFGPSVLATGNVLMAAVLAEGTTRIENAAMEPEVSALARCLVSMGAKIEGIGSHRLVVEGVERLHGAEVTIEGDRIEAGTFLIGAAMSGGDVTVTGIDPFQLFALGEILKQMGVSIDHGGDWMSAAASDRLRATDVTTLPFPGFPTDLQAQIMAAMSVADGISVVSERIFPDRFMHIAELLRLGARIRKEGAQAIVEGTAGLSGATVMASDLRASAALVLAGAVADGTTTIRRVYHIDRGYERIDARMGELGATIRRAAQPRLEKQRPEW